MHLRCMCQLLSVSGRNIDYFVLEEVSSRRNVSALNNSEYASSIQACYSYQRYMCRPCMLAYEETRFGQDIMRKGLPRGEAKGMECETNNNLDATEHHTFIKQHSGKRYVKPRDESTRFNSFNQRWSFRSLLLTDQSQNGNVFLNST